MRQISVVAAACLAAGLAGTASAAFTYVQSASAQPTYANVLNFDAPGSPTGNTASNAFAAYGVASLDSGVGPGAFVAVTNTTPGHSWLGTGNTASGSFGLYMKMTQQVSQMSFQYWDNSGPASFFGGGATLVLWKGGVQVDSYFINAPAYSPTAKPWFNITSSGGSTFDEIDFVGFGSAVADATIDNISWTSVPTPASAALLAIGGTLVARRRRN